MAAKQGASLFEVPIGKNGAVVCTQPKELVYLLTFASPPDNRLVAVSFNE